jgi:hypothetical protein
MDDEINKIDVTSRFYHWPFGSHLLCERSNKYCGIKWTIREDIRPRIR